VKERNGRRRSQQNVEAAGGSPPGRSASPLDSISAFSDASPPKDRRLSAKVSDTLGAVVLGKEEVTRRRSIGRRESLKVKQALNVHLQKAKEEQQQQAAVRLQRN
jgi:hypothetical protein